jgi:CRP/FNR family transcriptional regulator
MLTTSETTSDFPACASCTLRDAPLCDGTRRNGQTMLGRISRRRRADEGETLQAEGDTPSIVGFVLAGVLRLVKTIPDGRQQIVDLVYPGEFFGRAAGSISVCAVEAATDAELCVIDRRAFETLMLQYPELEHRMLAVVFDELAIARARGLILGCLTTQERIASFLMIALRRRERVLAGVAKPAHKRMAVLQITRHDLARYLSTSVETISRTLHLFAREGVIRLVDHDHFEILDCEALLDLSGLAADDLAVFSPSGLATKALLASRPCAESAKP